MRDAEFVEEFAENELITVVRASPKLVGRLACSLGPRLSCNQSSDHPSAHGNAIVCTWPAQTLQSSASQTGKK